MFTTFKLKIELFIRTWKNSFSHHSNIGMWSFSSFIRKIEMKKFNQFYIVSLAREQSKFECEYLHVPETIQFSRRWFICLNEMRIDMKEKEKDLLRIYSTINVSVNRRKIYNKIYVPCKLSTLSRRKGNDSYWSA